MSFERAVNRSTPRTHRSNLVAIADWCAVNYVTPGDVCLTRAETLLRIKEYLKDALVTVTQQVSVCATTMQSSLDQQALDLQEVDSTMALIENRLASQKEQIARSAMLAQCMRKLPAQSLDLDDSIETKAVEPVFRTPDGLINFDALDKLGRHPPRPTAPASARPPPPPLPPPPQHKDGKPLPAGFVIDGQLIRDLLERSSTSSPPPPHLSPDPSSHITNTLKPRLN